MGRLTERHNNGTALITDITTGVHDVIRKLADYEDAEEKGLLLRLPCKVGTQVWKIKEYSGGGRIPNWHEIYDVEFDLALLNDFEETVFLTREEAEKALADMGV